MLEIILAFRNYMNREQRGNAVGFKLLSLTREEEPFAYYVLNHRFAIFGTVLERRLHKICRYFGFSLRAQVYSKISCNLLHFTSAFEVTPPLPV